MNRIGIRRENKNQWERRVPLVPDEVVEFVAAGMPIIVERSPIRAFVDAAYATAGAELRDDVDDVDLIMGVKEVPSSYFTRPAAWMYFSHTIKGQPQNMPALRKLLDSKGTLFDYELIVNDEGERLVFFGRHAGYAGAIEALVALGQRWKMRGIDTPLAKLKQPFKYTDLAEVLAVLEEIGTEIEDNGLPQNVAPVQVAVMGDGNVSLGVRKILDALPTKWHAPEEYRALGDNADRHRIHATVLREKDLVEPRGDKGFDLQEYYDHPDRFRSVSHQFLPMSTLVFPTYYWDEQYPKFITNEALKDCASEGNLKLEVIADITCDIDGSIEPTTRCTDPGEPCFTFDPMTGSSHDGLQKDGIAIMAIDALPSELSVDASRHFSKALQPFMSALSSADFDAPTIEKSGLPPILKRACIAWRGELTELFKHLETPLNEYGSNE